MINVEQARIAEEAGAVAVMALERIPADIRVDGGVARMSDPKMIREIKAAVSIPVMAKVRKALLLVSKLLLLCGNRRLSMTVSRCRSSSSSLPLLLSQSIYWFKSKRPKNASCEECPRTEKGGGGGRGGRWCAKRTCGNRGECRGIREVQAVGNMRDIGTGAERGPVGRGGGYFFRLRVCLHFESQRTFHSCRCQKMLSASHVSHNGVLVWRVGIFAGRFLADFSPFACSLSNPPLSSV